MFIDLGADKPETSISEVSVATDIQCFEKFSGDNELQPADDPKDKFPKREIDQLTASFPFSPPFVLRSAFGHMKVTSVFSSVGLHTRDQHNCIDGTHNEEDASARSNKILPTAWTANLTLGTVRDAFGKTSSYACNLSVDPFWPLCMYELRGKCNNEECAWQHIKDYTNSSANQYNELNNAGMNIPYKFQRSIFHAYIIL